MYWCQNQCEGIDWSHLVIFLFEIIALEKNLCLTFYFGVRPTPFSAQTWVGYKRITHGDQVSTFVMDIVHYCLASKYSLGVQVFLRPVTLLCLKFDVINVLWVSSKMLAQAVQVAVCPVHTESDGNCSTVWQERKSKKSDIRCSFSSRMATSGQTARKTMEKTVSLNIGFLKWICSLQDNLQFSRIMLMNDL